MYCVGLDVHSSRSSLDILDPQGAHFKHLEVKGPWPKLLEAVDQSVPKPFAICFEASCGYGHLYEQFAQRAARVEVAHPGHLRLIFRSKRKNDRFDSAKLAKILHLDLVPKVHVPKAEIRQWRGFIEFRRSLLGKRNAIKSQVRALCRGCGITDLPKGRGLFTRKGVAELRHHPMAELDALRRDMLLQEFNSLDKQRERAEKQLAKMASRHPEVALLMTIPGVGIRTAEAVVAYIDDVRRFTRVNRVGAYFGMVPRQDASADKNHLGHITKDGPGTVRWLICEAAWQGVRRSATIKAFHDRVMRDDPDRKKIALVATGHYLLRVMTAMLRTGELWREQGMDLSLQAPPVEAKGPTQESLNRPNRLVLHDGARVASQQSPVLRVDNSTLPPPCERQKAEKRKETTAG
jgi:transposase